MVETLISSVPGAIGGAVGYWFVVRRKPNGFLFGSLKLSMAIVFVATLSGLFLLKYFGIF
ncbi:MAG: hypothetical protein AAFN27_20190 [Pseudomonadota bacterium]